MPAGLLKTKRNSKIAYRSQKIRLRFSLLADIVRLINSHTCGVHMPHRIIRQAQLGDHDVTKSPVDIIWCGWALARYIKSE